MSDCGCDALEWKQQAEHEKAMYEQIMRREQVLRDHLSCVILDLTNEMNRFKPSNRNRRPYEYAIKHLREALEEKE